MARPKIETATLRRERHGRHPRRRRLNEAKGPSATFTFSPISKTSAGLRLVLGLDHLAANALGLAIRDRNGLRLVCAQKASDLRRVLDQVIGIVRQIDADEHVAGRKVRSTSYLRPRRTSITFSLGTRIFLKEVGKARCSACSLIESRTFFSKLEKAWTIYQRLAMVRNAPKKSPASNEKEAEAHLMIWSTIRKKIAAMITITNTMPVVISVSRRVGQVILEARCGPPGLTRTDFPRHRKTLHPGKTSFRVSAGRMNSNVGMRWR